MEQLANFLASTALNMPGDLDAVTVTLTVSSIAAPFPTAFPFRIRIDDELMKVTATPGTNQWTVVRGDGGTTAAIHLDGSTVRAVLSKESIDNIVSIQQNGTEVSNRRVLNFINAVVADNSGSGRADITIPSGYEHALTAPVLADWSWLDQHSVANAYQLNGAILLEAPHSGYATQEAHVLYRAAPATPYTATFRCRFFGYGADCSHGVCFLDSTPTKFLTIANAIGTGSNIYFHNFNSTTTYNNSYGNLSNFTTVNSDFWYRLEDDGTNRNYYISLDGTHWNLVLTKTRTDILTAANVGFFVNPSGSASYSSLVLSSFAFG